MKSKKKKKKTHTTRLQNSICVKFAFIQTLIAYFTSMPG